MAPRAAPTRPARPAATMVNAYYITYGLPVTISRGQQYRPVPVSGEGSCPFVTNALNNMALPVYGDGKQMRDYRMS